MGLGHQKRGRAQQKLPPIMWTDLVFHLPPCQPPLEDLPLAKAREAWRSAGPPGKVADSSGRGHRTGRRKERKKLAPRAMAPLLEHRRGGTGSSPPSCSTSKTPAEALSAPQPPRDAASREKPKLRKILVDLRPVLENVMEPWDSWEGCSETRSVRSAGCSPRECGQPSRGGRDSRGGASAAEDQTHRVTSLPPIAAQPRDSGQAAVACKPPLSQAQAPRDGALARRAAPRQEPTAPVTFPKISLQPEPAEQLPPPERSSSAETAGAGSLLRPERSPDIQLPTRLLLQRLQETTTSQHHQLIAQALQALRKELQGEAPASPSEGERWRLLREPALNRKDDARRRNRKAVGLHPGAAERRLVKLTWRTGRPWQPETLNPWTGPGSWRRNIRAGNVPSAGPRVRRGRGIPPWLADQVRASRSQHTPTFPNPTRAWCIQSTMNSGL
ncbi:uncharacterized protein LOC115638615 isoform X1 [Gopherus evgoodei]|uniref:uncharacterized protein LOC115638615 isoform X1 n=1 Tax=Gopherus evgoodei TaxID=1825980 RepID=UPI0011CFF30C|nr:uncharacterized protein LOC115638615 isoform X1 [Gopherus evgoodei]